MITVGQLIDHLEKLPRDSNLRLFPSTNIRSGDIADINLTSVYQANSSLVRVDLYAFDLASYKENS